LLCICLATKFMVSYHELFLVACCRRYSYFCQICCAIYIHIYDYNYYHCFKLSLTYHELVVLPVVDIFMIWTGELSARACGTLLVSSHFIFFPVFVHCLCLFKVFKFCFSLISKSDNENILCGLGQHLT
jgi:hypothetical protein